MDKKAALIHVLICIAVGGVIAYFSSAKWLAASFWVSAALFINGSLAWYEDALPGGFENPDGSNTPDFAQGSGAFAYWARALAITAALGVAGYLVQEYT